MWVLGIQVLSSERAVHAFTMFVCTYRLICLFTDRVSSLCTFGCPETRSIDQAGLELTFTRLCLLSAEIKGVGHYYTAFNLYVLSSPDPTLKTTGFV